MGYLFYEDDHVRSCPANYTYDRGKHYFGIGIEIENEIWELLEIALQPFIEAK